jgi:type II secretory pathway pseudopilin PulG
MTARLRRRRDGVVLFEVLIALVILSSAGVAAVTLASTVTRTIAVARDRDQDVREASAFLDDVALWSREDLDRHLGQRDEGVWLLRIDHPVPSIYSVVLSDTGAAGALLQTFVYRPRPTDADAR